MDAVYLIPGFFGFANLGDLKYFAHVVTHLAEALAARGLEAKIECVRTLPTASVPQRAVRLAETIARTTPPGDAPIHLIGHSSGGLDARMLCAPGVVLPTPLDVAGLARRVRTVTTVATPHRGTPLASLFTGLLGTPLLKLLSLWTIHVLRFGVVPMSVLLGLGGLVAKLDDRVGTNSALLDELYEQLLGDFSPERRQAISQLLRDIEDDRGLLPQLAPESMEVFNATTRDSPGVRVASVTSRAAAPGLGGAIDAGLDPAAQATHALYHALYRLAARGRADRLCPLTDEQAARLREAYDEVPDGTANDGIVPTRSQVWGTVIHAARGDHLDVIGHFAGPEHEPPHVDWIASGSRFTRERFVALWNAVADHVACSSERGS